MENLTTETPAAPETESSVVLAIASVDTKGGTLIGEDMGGFAACGISQD